MAIKEFGKKVGTPVVKWYGKYERPISSVSLIGGFLFDVITLKRVDALWENIWVLGHIFLIATIMILVNWLEAEPGAEKNPQRMHFWLVNALQFLFGGVLSVFLVFYFRSGDLATSWPFILLLTLAFWANESLKRRFVRLAFQVTLLFLSIFSTAIFLVPIFFHRIGTDIFIYSGFISLALMFLFLSVLSFVTRDKYKKNRMFVYLSIIGVYSAMNFLYFTNLIPPLPLSIENSGVYYSVEKSGENYIGEYMDVGLISYFQIFPNINTSVKNKVYAYSAVFSPTSFDTTIYHEWQYFDSVNRKWIIYSTIPLRIVGGREGGFRTYSVFENLSLGKWRVNVVTKEGLVIGRIRFEVVSGKSRGAIRTEILD